MKKIFVLDAYTNGHNAALKLMRCLKWKRKECDLVFCGNHRTVLERLSEGPGFALVAVHNSSRGPVTDVAETLRTLTDKGFRFNKVAEISLKPDHCLVVPRHITDVSQIERVMSHPQALRQCSRFLDEMSIAEDDRIQKDSTAGSAKAVSRMNEESHFAAIASKAAAKAYGLNILRESIEDDSNNVTTFHLFENKAEIEPVTVGIIGIEGRFGKALEDFFRKLGCKVIGSDPKLPGADNAEIVRNSEVVIFSVPIKETPLAIEAMRPFVRKDQLLTDVTSVKTEAVRAMMKTKGEVVGLHPMFAPEVGFDGQTIVVCPQRLKSDRWKTWMMNVLAATGSKLKWSDPAEHDTYMATVQASPHISNFVSAVLITEMGVPVQESLTFTSPFYRVMFSQMGRFLSQDPDLYSAIIMKNPATIPMLKKRIEIDRRLLKMVRAYDRDGFRELFKKAKGHFGKDVRREANELFLRIIALTKTLGQKNSVILEFSSAHDKPGLLKKIVGVFSRYGVNLSGINSVTLDDAHKQFTISFSEPKTSDRVQRALDKIESWQTPRVRVITD